MKKEFEMSQEQMDKLLAAIKPVPMIMLQCGEPRSQQEMANDAWAALGKEMGFKHMTVEQVAGKGQLFFKAESV